MPKYVIKATIEGSRHDVNALLPSLNKLGFTVVAVAQSHGNGHTTRRAQTIDRNKRITEMYRSNSKEWPTTRLAKEFNLSRERVCQILRAENAIGDAQARKEIAKEAAADVIETIKAETLTAWESKLEEALEYVRQGKSYRQSVALVGLPMHSNFAWQLSRRANLEGLSSTHGRWRDFSKRRARVERLIKKGKSVREIVLELRDKGDSVYEAWVYRNYPEAGSRRRQVAAEA